VLDIEPCDWLTIKIMSNHSDRIMLNSSLPLRRAWERITERSGDQATGGGSPRFRVITQEMNDSHLQPFCRSIKRRTRLPTKHQSPPHRLRSLHSIGNTEDVSKTQSVGGRGSAGALGNQPIPGDVSGRRGVLRLAGDRTKRSNERQVTIFTAERR
jgi:hypothetical protein